jgi:hypothetical protein
MIDINQMGQIGGRQKKREPGFPFTMEHNMKTTLRGLVFGYDKASCRRVLVLEIVAIVLKYSRRMRPQAASTFKTQYMIAAPTKIPAMKIRNATEVLVSGLDSSPGGCMASHSLMICMASA